MDQINKLRAGATGLVLALALAAGGTPTVSWNSGPDRVFAPPDVAYGPLAATQPDRVFTPPDVAYSPVAAAQSARVFAPADVSYGAVALALTEPAAGA